MREGYAEAMVDARVWKGRPRRWWHDRPADRAGMTGQAAVDWARSMALRFPQNVKVS